ncbi:MAG: phosphate signaling complex protein PhoU [Tepidisphaera sp.]
MTHFFPDQAGGGSGNGPDGVVRAGGGVGGGGGGGHMLELDRRIIQLKRRLIREATHAIAMLESSIDALWTLDIAAAKSVRAEDDEVDREEVEIEQEAFEILALRHVFARDFRLVAFILKVNADVERVADHATGIAKITLRIAKGMPPGMTPEWPTALRELGQRVPLMCHELLRAVLNEDVEAGRRVADSDEVIDQLDRRVFEESIELMKDEGRTDSALTLGLHVARVGRELERVGDLMKNIAEDLIYLGTGQIVRHAPKTPTPTPTPTPPA